MKRVRDERLRVGLEALVGNTGDVVAGREDRRSAGDDDAAGLDPLRERRERLGESSEDVVIERVSALGIRDREARDRLGGEIEEELAARERLLFRRHLNEDDEDVAL